MIQKEKFKDKKRKLSIRWIFQRIEIFTTRIKYKRKAILIKIFSMIALAFGFIGFNCNLDKIKPLKDINSLFQIKIINDLLGISLNLFFIVIYVFSFAIYVAVSKVMSKPITYIEDNEIAEMTFNPTTNDEAKKIIAPEAIVSYQNPKEKDVTIKRFFLNGTTEEDWHDKKEVLKNYYSLYIKGVRPIGSDKIEIALSKKDPCYPDPTYWNNKYLRTDEKDLEIVLGKNAFGDNVYWNMSKNSHGKFCGATRTGKTYMQKLINSQFLLLGHKLYIYDGKKIDYQGIWKQIKDCIVVNSELGLLNSLILLDMEHERRTKLLNNKLDTIDKYNATKDPSEQRQHIMVVIEEAADIFGKSFDKAEKDKQTLETEKTINEKTISLIEKLIRKGGATGIHVCLNSQKLTATMLPKQIPLNLTENWSSHVDTITSNIAIGNDDAHDLIPKDSKGIFVNEEHELIQSYLINDERLLYQLKLPALEEDEEIDGDLFVADLIKDFQHFKEYTNNCNSYSKFE